MRLVELGYIGEDGASFLINDKLVDELIQQYILELGFHNLKLRNEKKWIEGLSALLDIAETGMLLPQNKIDHLRKKFDLGEPIQLTAELTDTLSLNNLERHDT